MPFAPVILASKTRDGLLREMAGQMAAHGMIPPGSPSRSRRRSLQCGHSDWLRAPAAGLVAMAAGIGDKVLAGQVLGTISDPFGETETGIIAPRDSIIIGALTLPVANEGDAVFHLADLPPDQTGVAPRPKRRRCRMRMKSSDPCSPHPLSATK